jgi:hypothetical protein
MYKRVVPNVGYAVARRAFSTTAVAKVFLLQSDPCVTPPYFCVWRFHRKDETALEVTGRIAKGNPR